MRKWTNDELADCWEIRVYFKQIDNKEHKYLIKIKYSTEKLSLSLIIDNNETGSYAK